MLKLILSRGIQPHFPARARVVSQLYRVQVPSSKRFSLQSRQLSPNTEEPKEKDEVDDSMEKEITKDSKLEVEAASACSSVEAGDIVPSITNKRRSLRVREKLTSSLTPLNIEKLRLQLQFREASDAPCLSKLPAIPASQWDQARLSLLSCLNLPARREKANQDASSLFSAGDSVLLASIYPGSTYFLDSLVEHLAHSTKSSVLSFNVHDLQSMDFVNRAFPSNPDSALPLYPDSKSLHRLFSNVPIGGERPTQEAAFRREEDEDEDEDEEEDEDYDAPPPKSQTIYSSEVPGFFSFLSSSRPTPMLSSEDLLVGRRLRKGFFHLINDASWKGGAETDGLVIHFRDTISSLLDRAGHVVVRGLYQAIQDYRVASERKVALVVTVSPSFLNPLLLKNHSFSDVTRRFMSDVGRSDWARHFTLVNVQPYLLNPTSNQVALKPDGATAISAASWMQELDAAFKRRALEINLKNLFGLCSLRDAELKVNYDPADLAWSGHLATQIWPKVHLLRLASALTGYASESLAPLDMAALVHCLQLIPFPDFEPAPSSSPTEGGRPVTLAAEPLAPSKLELARRACDSYERKLLGCVVNPDAMVVGFEDIRIAPQTVATLQNLITLPLLRPAWFSTGVLARHFISGVLLFGPPGTGKTLLAKAVAKESGSTVLEIKGSDIYNKYVGEGEKAVQALFRLARRLTPCVVFIDEVDVLFGARRNDSPSSGRREIINQFMLEWDGLTSANKGIMIMAATNRPFDLDDAVLRRLPRRILVDLPNKEDRRHILQLHLRGETLSEDVCLGTLADKTDGYSGSDLKNLCVSAAVAALQDLVRTELGAPLEDKTFDLKKLSPPKEGDTSRVLAESHFVTALSQVNASISDEMGSVLELRKWDKQFGDGAKARSKKLALGFGTAVPPPMPAASL